MREAMRGTAIQSWFGYEIPFQERFRMIREAGFERVALFWGEGYYKEDLPKEQQPDLLARCGLEIENFHLPFHQANMIWAEGQAGEALLNCYKDGLAAAKQFGVTTCVLHATRTNEPPPITDWGMARFGMLAETAEKLGVNIAVENVARVDYMDKIFSLIKSPRLKVCYDAGHEFCYTPEQDIVEKYKDRLAAIHLSDNFGDSDQHLLPFEGAVDWANVMRRLKRANYTGAVMIEANQEEKICSGRSAETFLRQAYSAACRLLEMAGGGDR